eukprot:TRINITY_DN780_c0_g5_i1.p2 TRINITY_DN780_c0_g5~~TRINITY_DN780_c0_g5_i1.p2  ORF type:complete len:101 (+),score=25.86 TRINITY_DN780_c0_g5_i1:57-359(+)
MACCPANCQCQWGITGMFLGLFIVIAAGVFAFFPFYLDLFTWAWYEWMCFGWFCFGSLLFGFGFLYEICAKKTPFARELGEPDEEAGDVQAPVPYIMIAA